MAINYSPKVGELLFCDFGKLSNSENDVDGHLPPEMTKKRAVIVLNGKIGKCCVVIPISSTKDINAIRKGVHVPIADIEVSGVLKPRERWAKANMIATVSRLRLHKPAGGITKHLSRESVTKVQIAVMKSINASSLLKDQ